MHLLPLLYFLASMLWLYITILPLVASKYVLGLIGEKPSDALHVQIEVQLANGTLVMLEKGVLHPLCVLRAHAAQLVRGWKATICMERRSIVETRNIGNLQHIANAERVTPVLSW